MWSSIDHKSEPYLYYFTITLGVSHHSHFCSSESKMEPTPKISLNVHLQVPGAPPGGSSGQAAQAQDGSHTPNTPEIVNSIVNMTAGPFASEFRSSMQPPPVPPPVPPVPQIPLEPPQSVILSEKQELLSPMEPPQLTYTSAPLQQVIIYLSIWN